MALSQCIRVTPQMALATNILGSIQDSDCDCKVLPGMRLTYLYNHLSLFISAHPIKYDSLGGHAPCPIS